MNDFDSLCQHTMLVGAGLFALGMFGFLVRRNLIVMFLCVEMMLQGVSLTWIAAGAYHNQLDGQVMVILIIAVAACEAGLGLALVMMLYSRQGNLDILSWQSNREEGRASFVDHDIPESESTSDPVWPTLTPAGVAPEINQEDQLHRSHV
ncbi:MAG: NADH-quinone oxidoreductase subunit NuoK [Planctomycetota bacterium]|nr:NADH-quinone oxidoreductase subunit NuoK [Planctomycetota bacterium]MDA1177440.1 NADH-quinone oxidoreductase subunit NuoK [Planctomycetota bacterium]